MMKMIIQRTWTRFQTMDLRREKRRYNILRVISGGEKLLNKSYFGLISAVF
jgi:hypothetical protein